MTLKSEIAIFILFWSRLSNWFQPQMHALAVLYELTHDDYVNGELSFDVTTFIHFVKNLYVLHIKFVLQRNECNFCYRNVYFLYFVCNTMHIHNVYLLPWIMDLESEALSFTSVLRIRMNCDEIAWFVARSAHAKTHGNQKIKIK